MFSFRAIVNSTGGHRSKIWFICIIANGPVASSTACNKSRHFGGVLQAFHKRHCFVARNGSVWKKWFYRRGFRAVKIRAITLPPAMALSAASREHATEPLSRPTTATQSFWVVEFVWSMVNRFLPSCAKLIRFASTRMLDLQCTHPSNEQTKTDSCVTPR